jgi:MFS family permease
VQGVGAIVGGLLFTILAGRHGRGHMVLVSTAGLVVAYAVYAMAPTTIVAGIAVVCLGAGSASLFTSSMAIVQRDAPHGERGRILSITQAGMGLCYGVGVLWISIVGDWINMRVALLAACVVAATMSAIFMSLAPRWRAVLDGDVSQLEPDTTGLVPA